MNETTTAPGSLLIIDDEAAALRNLGHIFRKEGYEVVTRQSGRSGLKELETRRFDVVLTDLKMEHVDGMAIVRHARELYPDIECIVITGHATLNSAVEAMKQGAFHYIAKPYRLDEVRETVKNALAMVRLKQENSNLRRRIAGYQGQVNIITQHPTMQRLLEVARQIAATDCNVLITGESGTGKELLARYVHLHSQRANGPFVAVNCGALQSELLANELFGHEKGAYTGADQQKRGLIEMAHGGTLFLDEIAEMSPAMQVKLLRVLQEREVLRVGGTQQIKMDVRFIAATNRDLQDAIAAGRFRSDFYFRLNVVNLQLPPLRERRDDIPLLAYYFLTKYAVAMAKPVADISPDAMQLLADYAYPGNVRELANIIERGVALAPSELLEVAQLPEILREFQVRVLPQPGAPMPTLEQYEADYIRHVLERTRGNKSQAAQLLGIDRVSLWRKLKRYDLE